jgi:hypothetical protein
MRVQDGKPYRGQVYTAEEIRKIIKSYGMPQHWNPTGALGPDRYIEAQVWDDQPLLPWLSSSKWFDNVGNVLYSLRRFGASLYLTIKARSDIITYNPIKLLWNKKVSSVQVREAEQQSECRDVPLPIVKLNRWTLALAITGSWLLSWPLVTAVLFAILLLAVLFGQQYSLIFQIGRRLFASRLALAEQEDWRLQRFNNSIAVVLLGLAQVAFLLGYATVGWVLALMVALAATVALAGFCLGCFLYYQFKLNRFRLFGS